MPRVAQSAVVREPAPSSFGEEAWTSGAIVSTPAEVARFLDALLGGRLLPPGWLAAMRLLRFVKAEDGLGTVAGPVA
jgi:D-alanyl-D-alanine carboxypeptidase